MKREQIKVGQKVQLGGKEQLLEAFNNERFFYLEQRPIVASSIYHCIGTVAKITPYTSFVFIAVDNTVYTLPYSAIRDIED